MWLTNTYLEGPRSDYPIYGYLLFNPYTDWQAPQTRSLINQITQFGRATKKSLAFYAPVGAVDTGSIGDELNHRFSPMVKKIGWVDFGFLFTDRRLEDLDDDGANARWAFFKFSKELSLLGHNIQVDKFLAQCVLLIKGSSDPVQAIFLGVLKETRPDILSGVSVSLSGPSLSMGALRRLRASRDFVVTNIWD